MAMASRTTAPPNSRSDGKTRTSAARIRFKASLWISHPQNETASSISRELVSCSRRFRSGPSPTMVNRASPFRKSGAAARKARSQPFRGMRPPTKINSSLSLRGRLHNASVQREALMPFSGTKKSFSRYAENSAYVCDEPATIAAASR